MAIYDAGKIVQMINKNTVITSRRTARLPGWSDLRTCTKVSLTKLIRCLSESKSTIWNKVSKSPFVTAENLPSTRRWLFGIRPENIRLVDHQGENTFLCIVDTIVEKISTTCYRLHIVYWFKYPGHFIWCVLLKSGAPLLAVSQAIYA